MLCEPTASARPASAPIIKTTPGNGFRFIGFCSPCSRQSSSKQSAKQDCEPVTLKDFRRDYVAVIRRRCYQVFKTKLNFVRRTVQVCPESSEVPLVLRPSYARCRRIYCQHQSGSR